MPGKIPQRFAAVLRIYQQRQFETRAVSKAVSSKPSNPSQSSNANENEEGESEGYISVVTATGFISYSEPPYALLTIEYNVQGSECVEKPRSRQIRYLVSQSE
jgi:hypothetical protein